MKLLSVVGVIIAVFSLYAATTMYPGGFDWGRDYISTLLRGPAGGSRYLADAGVLLFCLSIAVIFARLARIAEFEKNAKFVRIGGIGSQVYAALTVTPMHDLMVTMSVVFLVIALVGLTQALYTCGETGFFIAGCACLLVYIVSAGMYYSGHLVSILPWAQRIALGFLAIWLVSLDFRFKPLPFQTGGDAT